MNYAKLHNYLLIRYIIIYLFFSVIKQAKNEAKAYYY
jgi:hypothetical protein